MRRAIAEGLCRYFRICPGKEFRETDPNSQPRLPKALTTHVQVSTIGYIVLESCTNVQLKGPTTLTYTQAQFPFAQATILAVTDSLHYTIQVWHSAGIASSEEGAREALCILSMKGNLP